MFDELCSKIVATALCGLNDVLKYTFKSMIHKLDSLLWFYFVKWYSWIFTNTKLVPSERLLKAF